MEWLLERPLTLQLNDLTAVLGQRVEKVDGDALTSLDGCNQVASGAANLICLCLHRCSGNPADPGWPVAHAALIMM